MRKYKLDDSLIFKPVKRQLTPEEELQEKQDTELFCDMLEKHGVASLLNPADEITIEQIRKDIRTRKLVLNDYNDGTGQYSFSDYLKRIMGDDSDKSVTRKEYEYEKI